MQAFERGHDRRKKTRLSTYLADARIRIAVRNQSLIELAFTYVFLAVVISVAARQFPYLVIVGIVIYSAFGYMIWTVLENVADTDEGSGFRLMMVPARWRRNGLDFFNGLRVIMLSLIFTMLWIPLFFVGITLLSGGYVHLTLAYFAQMQVPVVRPLWTALFVLPAAVYPILFVHGRLMRSAKTQPARRRKTRLGDRVLWTIVMILFLFFYIETRSILILLPFPLGQALSALLAILLTISTAAVELSFRAQTQRKAKDTATDSPITVA